MFSFMKKDKDSKEHKKEKEEKKKEKKERKEKEKREKHRDQTTQEELNRLEEVKRGIFRRRSDRDKKRGHGDRESQISQDDDDGGFLTRDSDSSTSLSSSVGRLSPGRQLSPEHPEGPRLGPPTAPKPKSILKSKGDAHHVSDNLDDRSVLRANTAYNQANSGIVPGQEKTKPKPMPRGSRGSLKEKPPEFMPPPPPESPPPPEKLYKASLKLPEIVPAKPPRVRELVIHRTKAGDFGFTLRKGVISQKDGKGDAKQTVIFAEPGAGQSSSQTGLIPGDRLIEVNTVNVENKPREEIIDLIRKTGDTVVLQVQPIPELVELSVRPAPDGSGVDVQEEVVKGGTLKRSGSIRYRKPARSETEVQSEKTWMDAERV